MPEGDTVYRTARRLHTALAGRRLVGADLRVPRLATVELVGWTVAECLSRGKHLLLRLRPPGPGTPLTLHCHLDMDGAFRVWPGTAAPDARRGHDVRVVLQTADATAVGYRIHDLDLAPTAAEDRFVGHLGPDLLDPAFDAEEAVRRLSSDPDTPVGAALLNQRHLAGIGNVYRSELLFLRGVWPWTPVSGVADLPGLVALARRVLSANRDRAVRTTTGSLRRGETLYVYGRAGRPCRRCGTLVRSGAVAGRVVYWCPACQPERHRHAGARDRTTGAAGT